MSVNGPMVVATEEDEEVSWREARHLLAIFPVEIWQMIFNNIEDVYTFENLSNASQYFRKILAPERVHFLFPKVFDILAIQFDQRHDRDSSFNELMDLRNLRGRSILMRSPSTTNQTPCGSCSKIRELQWFSGLLRLRLVCTFWRLIIDKRIRGLSVCGEFWKESNDGNKNMVVPWWSELYKFRYFSTDLNHFRQHFQLTHPGRDTGVFGRSPYITRSITVQLGGRILAERVEEAENVILRYGHHLLKCDFIVESRELTILSVLILTMLGIKLPNIMVFELTGQDFDATGGRIVNNDLRDELVNFPVPSFPNLKHLRTKNVHPLIFNALIRSNSHITRLEVERNHKFENYNLLGVEMPNLTQLRIGFFSVNDLRKLGRHRQVKWPLEELILDLKALPEFTLLSWIFSLIGGKWAETMTDLWVELPATPRIRGTGNGRIKTLFQNDLIGLKLNLPKVTRLKLIMRNVIPLDFILPMKQSLEKLEIEVKYSGEVEFKLFAEKVEKGCEVKLLSLSDEILESNIWEKFQKLKQIFFKLNDKERVSFRREWMKKLTKK